MTKDTLFQYAEAHKAPFIELSDYIYDHPEIGFQEFKACAAITDLLERSGFTVERNIADIKTAFRATYENGSGGPAIGLLCEYDALENIGHACSHHLQSPIIALAAVALKDELHGKPFKLVIYGTPAEEGIGGKITMVDRGCFRDVDVTLMVHGWDHTFVDVRSYAMNQFKVHFYGKAAHAALCPYEGKSAFDALLLAFQGIEFLREHVHDTCRMHYTVLDAGGPANVVPAHASGHFILRSFSNRQVQEMEERFRNIVKGAALMADVDYEIQAEPQYIAKIPAYKLNDLMIENAKLAGAKRIIPPIEEAGSTDYANVMYLAPGAVIRLAFTQVGDTPHTDGMLKAGKSEDAHQAIVTGAQIITGVCYDLITDPGKLQEVKEDFRQSKEKALSV